MRVKIVEIYMATSSEPFQVWVEIWEENPDGATPITHKKCFSEHEIIIANREAITTIADALNAPVLASKKVLKAMAEVPEAKFKVKGKYPINESFIYYSCFYEDDYIVKDTVIRKKGWYYWSFVEYPHSVVPSSFEAQFAEVKIGDYIQAHCPLALQVLLGFTVEGVPKDE
jgi:hypothetical protein